jgi:predicted cupin superfamily sugar epimerase
MAVESEAVKVTTLGHDLASGARPQVIVPAGVWQSAVSLGAWTLTGCTVSPAFEFSGFEMAPQGWAPGGGDA